MTIGFRDATTADAPALDRLFKDVFCDTFAHLYRVEDLSAFLAQFTPRAWRAELSDPGYAFHLAEADSEAVGYAKLGPLKLPVDEARSAILLSQLYVRQDHHGAGIAQHLMDWAFAEAKRRGKEQLYLTVFTENHRARRFYQRLGFEDVGPYAFMVGSQADEDIIMRKAV
ncbi:GNAT family N-acetyltransferase [Sphingomonas sp. URHD0057]|uniref:GNAT family N-acetyltransferase n=1 Tax=Sphingomonas sp. URHD0057 TaxID=1380389 RepID=UPI00048CCEF4|nr:GNAT family N-acetyltransferase [Sphingomonas sp. URHD0057]